MKPYKRIFTIVIDSLGVGAMPNAAEYDDVGCDLSLIHISSIGCSVRTCNRIILTLSQEGLVDCMHGKLQISEQQITAIKKELESSSFSQ